MEDDPMLGDEATQQAYADKLVELMREQAEADRARRRSALQSDPSPTVLVGAEGFGDSPHSLP